MSELSRSSTPDTSELDVQSIVTSSSEFDVALHELNSTVNPAFDTAPVSNSTDPSDSASPPITPSKHPRFYFPDGSLQFLVRGTEYCIHRSWLIKHTPEGSYISEFEPEQQSGVIELEDVTVEQMDALLKILYPSAPPACEVTSADEWTFVMRLATRWGFTNLRKVALTQLDALASPIDKLSLAHEFDITSWLEPSYIALAQRREPLTFAEASRLPLQDVLFIHNIKQSFSPASLIPSAEQTAQRVRFLLGSADTSLSSVLAAVENPRQVPPSAVTPAQPSPSRVSDSSSQGKPAIPADRVGDINIISQLLSQGECTRAVNCVPTDITQREAVIKAFVSWINLPLSQRTRGSISALVVDILGRAIVEPAFLSTAMLMLHELSTNIYPHTANSIGSQDGRKGQITVSSGSGIITSTVGSSIRDCLSIMTPGESYVVSSLYIILRPQAGPVVKQERHRNAYTLIAKLLDSGFGNKATVCNYLGPSMHSITTLRERLLILGPSLDKPTPSPDFNKVLSDHEEAIKAKQRADPTSAAADIKCLDEIKSLRERKWQV